MRYRHSQNRFRILLRKSVGRSKSGAKNPAKNMFIAIGMNRIRKQVHTLHTEGRPVSFKPDGWNEIRDTVRARAASEDSDVVVARFGDEIVGVAIIKYIHRPESSFRPAEDFCHIEEFGVDEKYRRRGITTALVGFIRKHASGQGLKKLNLDVYQFNKEALMFYESAGFRTYRRDLELGI